MPASVTSVSASTPDGAYNTGDTITLLVTFDSTVHVTGAPRLALSTGGVADYVGGGGTTTLSFSYVVQSGHTSADLDYSGASALATNGGEIVTLADNIDAVLTLPTPGTAGSLGANKALVIDTTAPTVVITSDVPTLKAGDSATITFTFSEDPTGTFTWNGAAGDVTVSGGTLSAISGSGLTRTATFTPADATNGGTASITLHASSYADAAGNLGAGGTTPSLTFDTLPPGAPSTPTLAGDSDSGALGDNITNDATPSFTGVSDGGATVTLYDGATALGSVVADGAGSWRIESSALSQGAHTITAVARDAAGNTSTASAGLPVTIDTQAPTASIALADTSLQNGETTTVTVTFSEAVTGFTLGDLTAQNAVLSTLSTNDNITYTAILAPTAGVSDATNLITLNNTGVNDRAGNTSSGTTVSGNYSIDSGPPPQPEPEPEPGVVTVVTPAGAIVTGDAQDNLITPSGGADTVSAGAGDDTVQGGAGHDVLQGNVGDDSIAAGGGSDLVYGGQSHDFLQGNTGEDRLYGDKGEDTLHGGQDADFVQGGQGGDYVSGDLGDDVVLGGQGDDQVLGGAGNDYLSGDLGADTLTGGTGADIFHSSGSAGLDLVTDFNHAEGDRVLLEPGTTYALSQVGGDVHITMTGGGELVLAGVQLSSLADGWITA